MTDCVHHWVIDSPLEATSGGVCKRCGATREFDNRIAELPPAKYATIIQKAKRQQRPALPGAPIPLARAVRDA